MVQILMGNKLVALIILALFSSISFAGERAGHSHAPGEDWQLIVGAVVGLAILGGVVHFFGKKK